MQTGNAPRHKQKGGKMRKQIQTKMHNFVSNHGACFVSELRQNVPEASEQEILDFLEHLKGVTYYKDYIIGEKKVKKYYLKYMVSEKYICEMSLWDNPKQKGE